MTSHTGKMKLINTRSVTRWGTAAITGALMLGLAAGAQAQGGNGGNGGNNRFGNMTPEQRQQFMAQMETQRAQARETWQRQAMAAAGLTDEAAQTAVIEYGRTRDVAKATLQEQARALSTLITTPTTPEATIATELAAFRAAVAAYEKQQETDLAALDTKVKYSTSPRVGALLTLLGIIGDETTTLGGIGAVFPDSPYGANGRGGRNGGQGGRNGGQGGRGGRGGRGNNAQGGANQQGNNAANAEN